ncbi:alpha-L-rhamnosidase-related protein [Pedobacter africanus]|uniref:Alpha-L-rhamnosidase n=1 Tax=Pedobacter africanus TaxID=151894 RepID=A0A1W1Z8P2_9SPHI|nr:alpha-L-rhamnosidase C-terminal domain-containing protein [Pedobacter africanus]SMC44775.1 alpha-L-rhamnosidase [Pedobacter africanus]
MNKYAVFLVLLNCAIVCATNAQLPPAFKKSDKEGIKKDPRVRYYLPPERMVWQSDTTGKYLQHADRLLKVGNGQAELINKDLTVLKNDKNSKTGFLIDFGKEIFGGLQITTGLMKTKTPVKVRVRFGESVTEAMSDVGGTDGATNDHAMRDFMIELPWLGGLEVGNTGFRFVRIDLLEADAELLLKEVNAIFMYRDIPYLGSFHSNDERLNQIWATGAYTVHLNMQQYLWDGIKRDKLVWIGDTHPEMMVINSVFGYNEVVPMSLDLAKAATPLPAWMNGISSYSMWWVLIQRDWYLHQGDMKYLQLQRQYLVGLLKQLMTKIKDGKEALDGNRFLDWPSSENKPAIHAGLQAMLVMTLTAGSELCHILKETETARSCDEAVAILKKNVPDIAESKQAAALLALAGLLPAEQANAVLSKSNTGGFSTFYGYYMLQAKAMAGDYQGAINNIRDYWGGMLDLGATTFWEDFDLSWKENAGRIDEIVPKDKIDVHATYGAYCYKNLRHSLAHGWAAGPTSWLTTHVLGIKVMAPGCKVVKIEPHLGDLKSVRGSFPTPFGLIKVNHLKMPDGKIKTSVDAPKQVKIIK